MEEKIILKVTQIGKVNNKYFNQIQKIQKIQTKIQVQF